MSLNSREVCSLPFPPGKRRALTQLLTLTSYLRLIALSLFCRQSPAEIKTLAQYKDSRVLANTAISVEGWDVTQVAPPLALMDGFRMIQAVVLLLVPCVP